MPQNNTLFYEWIKRVTLKRAGCCDCNNAQVEAAHSAPSLFAHTRRPSLLRGCSEIGQTQEAGTWKLTEKHLTIFYKCHPRDDAGNKCSRVYLHHSWSAFKIVKYLEFTILYYYHNGRINLTCWFSMMQYCVTRCDNIDTAWLFTISYRVDKPCMRKKNTCSAWRHDYVP